MINYVHPGRISAIATPIVTAAGADTTQAHGRTVRLRAGQEVSLTTILAQRAADERASAARSGQ